MEKRKAKVVLYMGLASLSSPPIANTESTFAYTEITNKFLLSAGKKNRERGTQLPGCDLDLAMTPPLRPQPVERPP
ncbi:MAG: hypothetical protein COB48_09325 [Pseudoalteromonas sp.]|nr:MAG: hypothetical protein COB48_09325 [Pseudoalteromonas sp.]